MCDEESHCVDLQGDREIAQSIFRRYFVGFVI